MADPDAPDLSVIILNWNTRDDLQRCLDSIHEHPPNHSVEIIVADNASEDDSVAMVQQRYPEVRIVANERNLGFGAGNNRAIPHARGRYVLFLNSVTVASRRPLRMRPPQVCLSEVSMLMLNLCHAHGDCVQAKSSALHVHACCLPAGRRDTGRRWRDGIDS